MRTDAASDGLHSTWAKRLYRNDHAGRSDRRTEAQGEPIEVDFRVDSSNGRFVVIDASIVGVWLALEERDQFTAFLEENNGNLDGLTTHLNMLTNRLRGGGPSTPTH